jgi:tyrosyl-tRNA synthetase
MTDLIAEFRWRGFLAQSTCEDIAKFLLSERRTIYVGFDPTAASLHLGNLVPVMGLAHAQRHGHRPIALVGGGTGLIGDPSGKSAERILVTREKAAENAEGIRKQLSRFIDLAAPGNGLLLNNANWLTSLNLVNFLRDVGKHFSVNEMIKRDSVRTRLEERDQGISYTEFSYMLLQSYDFLHLAEHHGCTMQMGGSDQWGNIVSGKDLIRRMLGTRAEGVTFPLLTTSSGQKFGKTEEGAVWLDADLSSPYQMFQYWMQTPDADVASYLKLFTFLEQPVIADLETLVAARPEAREAQHTLASECTRIVHGNEAVRSVDQASRILFGAADFVPGAGTIALLGREVPSSEIIRTELDAGVALPDFLVRANLVASKGAARKLIEGGGVYVNNKRVAGDKKAITAADIEWPGAILVRSGKKSHHLLIVR